MKILDLQTGSIHEYGTNVHDSLYVSTDGRYLTYYNLQNVMAAVLVITDLFVTMIRFQQKARQQMRDIVRFILI